MEKFYTAALAILIVCNIQAQQSQKTYGGSGYEKITSMIPVKNGNYLIYGYSNSPASGNKTESSFNGSLDIWVLLTNSKGKILKQNTIGGDGEDAAGIIVSTKDNGYMLFGGSSSSVSGNKTAPNKGGSDCWIIKLDSNLAISWQKTIGSAGDDGARKVVVTPDGGYLMLASSNAGISGDKTTAGQGETDLWILKLSSTADIEWQKTIGGSRYDDGASISLLPDGNYLIGAESNSPVSGDKTQNSGTTDFWILKIDTTGNIIWQQTIGGGKGDYICKALPAKDGGILVGGYSESDSSKNKAEDSRGSVDYWLLKLNTTGQIQWQRTLGGSSADVLKDFIETDDGGLLLAGHSSSRASGDKTENNISPGFWDDWFIKLNSTQEIEWQHTIGAVNSDYPVTIIPKGNRFIIAGGSDSPASSDKTSGNFGSEDFWIMQLNNDGSVFGATTAIHAKEVPANIQVKKYLVYPNPANQTLFVQTNGTAKITLYNAEGKTLVTKNVTGNGTIDIIHYAPGLYYLQDDKGNKEKIMIFR